MARTRKTFGPLLYSTLVVAALVVLAAGALRLQEWASGGMSRAAPDPDASVAALIPVLANGNSVARATAVRSLGEVLFIYGSSGDVSGPRGRGLTALSGALKDEDPSIRAAAAEALGNLHQSARSASSALRAALKDEDLRVQSAAAQALLKMGEDLNGPALHTLIDLASDPMPVPDRRAIVEAMLTAGEPGIDAAVKALVGLLSNEDEGLRSDAVSCVSSLGPKAKRILPALEPLLKGDNPSLRCTAALAAQQAIDPEQKPDPLLISTLERAVTDPSLSYALRENAIGALYSFTPGGPVMGGGGGGMAGMAVGSLTPGSLAPGSPATVLPTSSALRRCGRELARQLDYKDVGVRLAAAMLLHLIDPETLAGKNEPAEGP
jgi:HEAT repeat protein